MVSYEAKPPPGFCMVSKRSIESCMRSRDTLFREVGHAFLQHDDGFETLAGAVRDDVGLALWWRRARLLWWRTGSMSRNVAGLSRIWQSSSQSSSFWSIDGSLRMQPNRVDHGLCDEGSVP